MLFRQRIPLLILICISLLLNSCGKQGAESLSEIGTMLYKALKSQKFESLNPVIPNQSGMEKYLELYELNKFKDAGSRKSEAANRVAAMRAKLKKEFTDISSSLMASGVDLTSTELKDLKYSDGDTKEGYRKGDGTLSLSKAGSTALEKVMYEGIGVKGRWFISGDLKR